MDQAIDTTKPTWRKVVDFPLMTMLIAVAIYIGTGLVFVLLKHVLPAGQDDGSRFLRMLVSMAMLVAAYKLLIARLGEHPRDDLRGEGAVRNLLLGLVAGLVIFSLVVGIAALLHVYRIIGQGDTSELVKAALEIAVIPAITEEILFRGILFRWIEEFAGSWFALAFTSALFGLGHIFNPNATYFSSFAIAVEAGVLLGGAYMLTRSLWFPMGLHAAWNFTQGEIFDVPVSGLDSHGLVEAQLSGPPLLSGGAFGLEASVIALVLATGAGVAIVIVAIRRGQVIRPLWVRRRLEREAVVSVPSTAEA